MSIKFDITGDGEFAEAMEKAMKQFPASAEKVLRKEARNIAEDLGTRVNAEAKGHHWKAKDSEEEPVRLAESFRQGKVIRSGTNYTVAVTTKAPHYHLYEEGHDLVTHNRKNRWEKENRELEEKLVRYTLKRLLENIWHDVQNIPKQSARSF